MRLLNVKTYSLEEFFEPQIPSYAILSHRWEGDEVTFADIQGSYYTCKKAFEKVRFACNQASEDGLGFVWIDTCCIDKSSSAELQETINSMFRWYHDAVVCYAFLSDVQLDSRSSLIPDTSFTTSTWFKRGWTLQELIAPKKVMFYGIGWSFIGSRAILWDKISHITGIHREVLWQHRKPLELALRTFSIAQRMSWAAHRETTRIEDRAYSLMGLFSVSMPLLYGEGQRAFVRLQEEILKLGTDLSILAWRHCSSDRSDRRELLAAFPEDFADCNTIVRSPQMDQPSAEEITLTMTNIGLRVEGPLIVNSSEGPSGRGLALSLECRTDDDVTKVIALKLEPLELEKHNTICHSGWDNDGARGESRLLSVGLLQPARSPSWPALTISREFIPSHLSRPDAAHWYTHAWVQLPEDRHRLPWSVLKLYPEKYWDFKNLTFNLRDAIYNRRGFDKISASDEEWTHGAIALSDNFDSKIAIFFAQKFDVVGGFRASREFRFKVSWYNPVTFPKPDEDLGKKDETVDKSIWISGRKAVVRLNNVKRSGILIAQLAMSIEPVKIQNFCEPPYELEAPDYAALINLNRGQDGVGMISHITNFDNGDIPP